MKKKKIFSLVTGVVEGADKALGEWQQTGGWHHLLLEVTSTRRNDQEEEEEDGERTKKKKKGSRTSRVMKQKLKLCI